MNQKGDASWELMPYRNDDNVWIPKAKVFIRGEKKILEAVDFQYEERKEAERHASYMVKEFIAEKG